MNKVFKVIWNHTTQSWVAVSELTSSKGKTKSKTAAKVTALSALVAGSVMGGQALAATSVSDGSGVVSIRIADITTAATAAGANAIAAGNGASAAGVDSIAIGNLSTVAPRGLNSIAIGSNASVSYPSGITNADSTNSIAIGTNALVSAEDAIAIGHGANIHQYGTGFASGQHAIAMGTNATSYRGGVSLGHNANAGWSAAVAIGESAVAAETPAIGAAGQNEAATAVGAGANATGNGATALGSAALANTTRSVAVGRSAKATGERTVAIGANANATAGYAIAIGADNGNTTGAPQATNIGSIAIGTNTRSTSQYTTAIGYAVTASGLGATAVGYNTRALAGASVVLGYDSQVNAAATTGAAIGANTLVNSLRGVALGARSNSSGPIGVAGLDMAENNRTNVYSNLTNSVNSTAASSINVKYSTVGGVSIGGVNPGNANEVNLRQLHYLAAGTADTDGVNVAQLRSVNLKLAGNTILGNNYTNAADVTGADVRLYDQTLIVNSTNTTFLTTDASNNTINITVQNQVIPTTVSTNANGTGAGSIDVNATTDGVATTKNVAEAINSAYWKVGDNDGTVQHNVSAGHQVNFVNGTATIANVTSEANGVNNVSFSINYGDGLRIEGGKLVANVTANPTVDNVTITTNTAGEITANTTGYSLNNNGTINVPSANGAQLMNASTIANAINNASFSVNAGAVANSTGVSTYTANGDDAKVKAGDTVNFNAGNNIEISGSGKTFNIATKENVSFTNITMGNGTGATTITNGTITNLNDHITAPTNATSTVTNATATTVPANISNIGNQAATVNDVINSGWNLQANNQSVDAVTHGNNVNFISTDNSITITPTTDGTNSSLSFTVNATALATAASGNISANASTGRAVVGQNGVADTTADAAGRTATVGDVANTINNTGWLTNVTQVNATTGATETVTKVVTPGTQVNYVNGNGTTANTTLNSDGSVSVSYDVAQNTANLTATNSTGRATLGNATTGANTFLNAQDTVNLINNTSFNVNSTAVTGTNGESTYTVNDESKVKAGDTVNLNAGQNIKIEGAGKTFNVSTTENATFTNMNVNSTLSIGGGNNTPVVNITTGTGNQTNGTTVTPTNTVDMGGSQLTNVSQGANVYGPNVDANGKPLTAVTIRNAAGQNEIRYYTADQFEANGRLKPGATDSTPVAANNVSNAMSGLADLASSNGSNAITVEDARNMGWVVSTSGNDYADKVQNANQVDFKAEANTGVTVKGATNATTGVREIVVGNDYAKTNSTGPAANAAGANSTAIGSNATSNAAGSIAIGQNANVASNAAPGSVAIGQGATAGKANQGDYRIDGSTNGIGGVPTENTRVFSVGNASSPAQIQNVAAGVVAANSTDAVNGSQLYATNQAITNNSQNINRLDNKVNRMNRDLRAGVAGANAAAGLPQVYIPGKSMVAASAGTFKGENALAVGYSRASDNGKVILKLQGNANSRGDVGGSVGVGYQW